MDALPPLFDANGPIGRGVLDEPYIPDAASLLRRMDRLGIARALAWSVPARDHHPATGNRRLLAELDALDPQRERLVPSFVLAPTLLYEPGALDDLAATMAREGLRAVRAFPAALRHRLHHLEPVLDRLLPLRPALFLDVRGLSDDREIADLAARFPEMPIVVLHAMWPQVFNFSLLDVMRRRGNVLLDTSWLHTDDTPRLIAREFGAERLVFATGLLAQEGAAIGALRYAGLRAEQMRAVACGNLERLLGLAPTPARDVPGLGGRNDLWPRFLRGERVGDGIVDAHAHLGALGVWPAADPGIEAQVRRAVRRMDELGIALTIASGQEALFADPIAGHAALERACAPFPERFRGYCAFPPAWAEELAPRLDEVFARPFFVGFKVLCDYWKVPVSDPRFAPMWRYADTHRLPILLHTWQGGYDAPAMLRPIVREDPGAFFLLGHSGGGDAGRREAEDLARECDNVYLEWCGSFTATRRWEETLARVGADRLVFGSDTVFHDAAWELGRLLSLDVPAADLAPALGATMRRILAARR